MEIFQDIYYAERVFSTANLADSCGSEESVPESVETVSRSEGTRY
jgi:hypothetical protein